MHARLARLAGLALCAGALGCGLFEELQDAEDASADGSGGAATSTASDEGGSETAVSCEVAYDDRCADQDTLFTCDPATGDVTEYSCVALCGGNLNFTCLLATNGGQHGCYCVTPGYDGSTCAELEGCLRDCVNAPDSGCSDQCFSRAADGTIRTYGALVYCAHADCAITCREAPEQCATCIETTITQGLGPCTVHRSLCDEDATEEPW
jgi:hypothetical protein